jgi:hypothetical protein
MVSHAFQGHLKPENKTEVEVLQSLTTGLRILVG